MVGTFILGSWNGHWNNHLEKCEFLNGKDGIPYMKWKIKAMFQTTNQGIIWEMIGGTIEKK